MQPSTQPFCSRDDTSSTRPSPQFHSTPWRVTRLKDRRRYALLQPLQCPSLRGRWRCWRLCGLLRALPMSLHLSWGQQKTAAEEIETRAAKHLAFQHLEAINVSRDRPGTPRQRHASFDRRIVVPQTLGKALKHPKRTLGCALQSGIELRTLALAHELGKVFRQGDGFGQLTLLGSQMGELLGLARRALVLTS
jgi:hypothetical protein